VGDAPAPVAETSVPAAEKHVSVESDNDSEIWYGIQIMGLGRKLAGNDPAFKGLRAVAIKSTGSSIYKYVTARSASRSSAEGQLKDVRKKFPEAFVVEVNGNVVKRSR
jgi:hypothetical protein